MPDPVHLLLVGTSHRHAPIDVREQLAAQAHGQRLIEAVISEHAVIERLVGKHYRATPRASFEHARIRRCGSPPLERSGATEPRPIAVVPSRGSGQRARTNHVKP